MEEINKNHNINQFGSLMRCNNKTEAPLYPFPPEVRLYRSHHRLKCHTLAISCQRYQEVVIDDAIILATNRENAKGGVYYFYYQRVTLRLYLCIRNAFEKIR